MKKKLNVILVHKEPIIERIPNLKSLIEFISENQSNLTIITSKSKKFQAPNFDNKNILIKSVLEKTKFLEIPTSLKVSILFLYTFIIKYIKKEKIILIFGGRSALILAGALSKIGLKKYISFIVEYPNILEVGLVNSDIFDRLEKIAIENSIFFITHDDLHGELINSIAIKNQVKYLPLPNSTLTIPNNTASKFLHGKIGISTEKKIILHSGGFGEWFSSAELSEISCDLHTDCALVFHLSHDISNDSYFNNYIQKKKSTDKSIFSMNPVSSKDLDRIVSSAHIGIAWYNESKLSFRAKMMGLAAGKIGHYLKCGIPVIAPKIKSLNYIEEYNCGLLVSNIDEIPLAVEKIIANHAHYKTAALSCYEELWEPRQYLNRILKEIHRQN